MPAIYNEIEPFAAAWIENLAAAGHIAPGIVDRRSIKEIDPDEVRSAHQFHAFAGIGIWSHALRLAGWPADRPVWTGSCPCTPFSVAGKRRGEKDDRHLWPAWFRLIRECRPSIIFGEQVGSKLGTDWIGSVSNDLESEGYAVAFADLPACCVGAPQKRQRLFFVAMGDTDRDRTREHDRKLPGDEGEHDNRITNSDHRYHNASVHDPIREGSLAHPDDQRPQRLETRDRQEGALDIERRRDTDRRGDLCHAWTPIRWIECSDGKTRPTKPGLHPLANGDPGRLGRLRAYGNAIVPQLAAMFIRSAVEAIEEIRP